MSRQISIFLAAILATAALAGCGAAPRVATIAEATGGSAPKAKATQPRPQPVASQAPAAKSQPGPFLTQFGAEKAAIAPDGQFMLFTAGRDGSRDLVLARPDGSQARALIEGAFDDSDAAWSPSGEWVAFIRRSAAAGATLVRHHMGRGQSEPWLPSQEPLADPAWLPGDQGVVFFSQTGNQSTLYKLPMGGGAPTTLWRGTGGASPTVSPDGSIVFEAVSPEGRALYRVAPGGKEAAKLKVEGEAPRQPSFSASGQSLAYVADGGVYVARADGSRAVRLVAGRGFSAPRWNPRLPQLIVTAESGAGTDLRAIPLPQR